MLVEYFHIRHSLVFMCLQPG